MTNSFERSPGENVKTAMHERLEGAAELRRQLFGKRMTDQIDSATDDFDRPFQDYVLKNIFGGPWLSGRLSKRELSLVNVGMLAGAGRYEEASIYIGAALRQGVSMRELQDLLMHITAYCGTPTGRQMFRATKEVLAKFRQNDENSLAAGNDEFHAGDQE